MTAVTTGREVATGTLWISKGDNTKVRVRVVARCGTPDCTYQGQINIYEEYSLGGSSSISEPARVINLSLISDVSSLNTTHPTLVPGATGSLKQNLSSFNDIYPVHETLWGFMLLLQSGEAVELFADTREQQQLWIKYLHLMSMFPLSPIPEEPRVNPIRESYRLKLKKSNFDADSVWPVYILSEEVGSRIQALGVHVVTLQSALSQSKPASMTIISPLDNEPIVTWEANRMRRTGSLGNLVFIEIGRRCEGGPGLIWMYSSPDDSISFRETITRFLFNGDARPVTLKPDPTLKYDLVSTNTTVVITNDTPPTTANSSPSSSGGSSFKLSYSSAVLTPSKKRAEYDSADPNEPDIDATTLPEYDYAYNAPIAKRSNSISIDPYGHIKPSSTLPISSSPPPVNLYTHPSRKMIHRRTLSNPPAASQQQVRKSQELTTGQLTKKYGGSTDSGVATCSSTNTLEEDLQEIDKSLNDILSDLTISVDDKSKEPPQKDLTSPDALDHWIASLEYLAKETDLSPQSTEQPNFQRSNTLPTGGNSPHSHRRTNSTSTCHPTYYLQHKKTRAELTGNNEYVTMKPVGTVQQQQRYSSRINYDFLDLQLSPIKEKSTTNTSGGMTYENYPPPSDVVKGTPVNFIVAYENVDHGSSSNTVVEEERDDDIYENTELVPGPPPLKEQNKFTDSFNSLISSTLSELDNLQCVLNEFNQ